MAVFVVVGLATTLTQPGGVVAFVGTPVPAARRTSAPRASRYDARLARRRTTFLITPKLGRPSGEATSTTTTTTRGAREDLGEAAASPMSRNAPQEPVVTTTTTKAGGSSSANGGNGESATRRLTSKAPVRLKPETLSVGEPLPRPEKKMEIEDMLRELREIQGDRPRGYCILGTRHCSYLHQQLIELLSYALVLSGNHVHTSGAAGTNAAAIRGALRAERPDLLTVVLPQSLRKQPVDSQELIQEVKHVVEMPENDALPLEVASRICNRRLIGEADQLVAFAFHGSRTVVEAAKEAHDMDKIVTIMYLD